jgi:TPP-dependent pyruvate/acetoin dehydrogenase alpha subunit
LGLSGADGSLCESRTFCQIESVPVVIHVTEVTQPQGHSTSGSHERYKSEDRLSWESEFDGLIKFREWILDYSIEIEGGRSFGNR